MTDAEMIAELQRQHEAATPGPWETTDDDATPITTSLVCVGEGCMFEDCEGEAGDTHSCDLAWGELSDPDRALIVAARNALPRLLQIARERDAVEEVDKEIFSDWERAKAVHAKELRNATENWHALQRLLLQATTERDMLAVTMPNGVVVPPCNGCGFCDAIAAALREAAGEARKVAVEECGNIAHDAAMQYGDDEMDTEETVALGICEAIRALNPRCAK